MFDAIRNRLDKSQPNSNGFGVIEVMISLFLLSLLAISLIPLLLNSLRSSGTNTTVATATQIVNQGIEGVRAVRSPTSTMPSCLDVTQFLQVTLTSVLDPRGVTLFPKWDATTCPTTYPGVVRARISVTRGGTSAVLAQAVTYVFVKSAT